MTAWTLHLSVEVTHSRANLLFLLCGTVTGSRLEDVNPSGDNYSALENHCHWAQLSFQNVFPCVVLCTQTVKLYLYLIRQFL